MRLLFMVLTLLPLSLLADVGEGLSSDCDGTCRTDALTGSEGITQIRATVSNVIEEKHRDSFCGAAMNGDWDVIKDYADRNANVPIESALESVSCVLANGTSQRYVGNMLHASVRENSNSQSVALGISNHLLRENPSPAKRRIFVGLVKGVGEQPNIFHQLRNSWNAEISNRGLIENNARIICLSIDRYNVDELKSIRDQECMTEPFAFPRRT